jgi:hypothetical protein
VINASAVSPASDSPDKPESSTPSRPQLGKRKSTKALGDDPIKAKASKRKQVSKPINNTGSSSAATVKGRRKGKAKAEHQQSTSTTT